MGDVDMHHQPADIQQQFSNSFTPKPVSMVGLAQDREDFKTHLCILLCCGETQEPPSWRQKTQMHHVYL